MTEPLGVEPSRLETAGTNLHDLVLPVPPAPMVAAGTDSVSAAINQTLPIMESPVVDGLPVVKAALTATGSNIATAARMYAETDQKLGDRVGQVQFAATAPDASGAGSAERLLGAAADQPADGEKPTPTPTPTPKPGPTPDLRQFGQLSQSVQTVMQGVQQMTSTMQGSGATPARLASDTTTAGESGADQAQLVDEVKKTDEEEQTLAEGAAPGEQTSGSVPTQPPTTGLPQTKPSEITL